MYWIYELLLFASRKATHCPLISFWRGANNFDASFIFFPDLQLVIWVEYFVAQWTRRWKEGIDWLVVKLMKNIWSVAVKQTVHLN